jgi:hypothetical protein
MRMRKKRREPIFQSVSTAEVPFKPWSVKRFAPQETASEADFQPGDFILTYSSSLGGRLIRFGQWLRYSGDDKKYIRWNHAAVIETSDGSIIEALGTGVKRHHISKYGPTEYVIVRLDGIVQPYDREQIVGFARWCLGEEYGWATIISIGLNMLTGSKFTFGVDGQNICSGMVARALERSNAIFQTMPSHIAPADLAKFFDVPAPAWLRAPDHPH